MTLQKLKLGSRSVGGEIAPKDGREIFIRELFRQAIADGLVAPKISRLSGSEFSKAAHTFYRGLRLDQLRRNQNTVLITLRELLANGISRPEIITNEFRKRAIPGSWNSGSIRLLLKELAEKRWTDKCDTRSEQLSTKSRKRFKRPIDGRTREVRRYKSLMDQFMRELGGDFKELGDLSAAEVAMVNQAATITLHLENLQNALLRGESIKTNELVRLQNSSIRILTALRAASHLRMA